ncbi:hypothetical protein Enr10x_28810 [Gimesia panareensis]|uniref:Peptidase M10 metallopeptidase domain-containing protein n=1 Tax=Gimesia panareensis TaxID=2527978 RepID=A0A517Q7H2_9PLAN|nr:hypothetical protein [Gimesia panareensis]QDT27563.1 hypothetical protein Enr10x_28810 [Gimesia panareensis]
MLLTNWLNTHTSRFRKRRVIRSRDRRALRRLWQTACCNRVSTVEVLEDRTLLTVPLASDFSGNAVAEGLIDLWTVIRHELGYLLGYEHTDQGVMEATLEPGMRKLPDWNEDTDQFFASFEEDQELLSF